MIKFKQPSPLGYSQYVEIDLGPATMVILAGQVSIDEQGATIGPNDYLKQAEVIFANIARIALEAGGSMRDVVKLNYYLVDMSGIQFVREVRNKFINPEAPPASTAVQVSKLFRDDIVLEIEATLAVQKR